MQFRKEDSEVLGTHYWWSRHTSRSREPVRSQTWDFWGWCTSWGNSHPTSLKCPNHWESFEHQKGLVVGSTVRERFPANQGGANHIDNLWHWSRLADASPFGLGAVLLQQSGSSWKPVAHASCSMTQEIYSNRKGNVGYHMGVPKILRLRAGLQVHDRIWSQTIDSTVEH